MAAVPPFINPVTVLRHMRKLNFQAQIGRRRSYMLEFADEPQQWVLAAQLMGMVNSTIAPSSLRMEMRIAPLL